MKWSSEAEEDKIKKWLTTRNPEEKYPWWLGQRLTDGTRLQGRGSAARAPPSQRDEGLYGLKEGVRV